MLDTLGTVFVFKSLANDEEISDRKRQNRMLKDLVRKHDKTGSTRTARQLVVVLDVRERRERRGRWFFVPVLMTLSYANSAVAIPK